MKNQKSLIAYILIGIGLYFLLQKLRLPIFTDFYSWQTLLIIIGLAFLIYSYQSKSYHYILIGGILLGVGVHLHGIANYDFWIDHWAMYLIIIGTAFLLRYFKMKTHLFTSFVLIGLGLLILYSDSFNAYFYWVDDIISFASQFWPVLIILCGLYLLVRRK